MMVGPFEKHGSLYIPSNPITSLFFSSLHSLVHPLAKMVMNPVFTARNTEGQLLSYSYDKVLLFIFSGRLFRGRLFY